MRHRIVWALTSAALLAPAGLLACGQPADAPTVQGETPTPPASQDLLARARVDLKDGALDPELKAEILASTDPAYARARRILARMDRPPEPPADETKGDAPPVVAPAAGPKPADAPGEATPAPAADGTDPAKPASTPKASPKPRPSKTQISGISLRETARGATLSLRAGSDVVVGMASQPQSGRLRLVIESAAAPHKVLQSRPSAGPVRVESVVKGDSSLIVTVAVPPGWTASRPRAGKRGATVELRAP